MSYFFKMVINVLSFEPSLEFSSILSGTRVAATAVAMVVVGLGIDIITRNASGRGRLETADGADVRRVGGLGDLFARGG